MHEVSIAESLLNEVAVAARRHSLSIVHAVGIRVGLQSGVAAEALSQAFEILRDGPLAAAALDVRPVDGADLCLEWIEGE